MIPATAYHQAEYDGGKPFPSAYTTTIVAIMNPIPATPVITIVTIILCFALIAAPSPVIGLKKAYATFEARSIYTTNRA